MIRSAVELARLPVDVHPPSIQAAMAASTTIPIVMGGSLADPVESGFVQSLARPGTNVTGLSRGERELDPKRLQLLVESVPTAISRVAVFGPRTGEDPRLAEAALGVELLYLPIISEDGYETGFHRAVAAGVDALFFQQTSPAGASYIASAAARRGLPTMYSGRGAVRAGGLMSYDARLEEIMRRTAEYVARILHGAQPAGLPVELPTHYDLIVNLSTARESGLTLSPAFLARADELIQ